MIMTGSELATWRTNLGHSAASAAHILGLSLPEYLAYERGFFAYERAYGDPTWIEERRAIPDYIARKCDQLAAAAKQLKAEREIIS